MDSFLELQLPEFDVRAAPGGADPSLEAAVEEKAVLPTTIAPAMRRYLSRCRPASFQPPWVRLHFELWRSIGPADH